MWKKIWEALRWEQWDTSDSNRIPDPFSNWKGWLNNFYYGVITLIVILIIGLLLERN